jgi:hypothetical protein
MAGGAPMEITEFDRLSDARDAWERIEAANPSLGVFETYAYADLWCRHFLGDRAVRGLIVARAGQPRLVLAFTDRGGRLDAIGQGLADTLSFPRAGDGIESYRAAVGYLSERRDWREIRLYEVSEVIAWPLENIVRNADFPVLARLKSICPYVPLERGWAGVLAGLSANFRHQIRKGTSNLAAAGIAFEHHRPVRDFDARYGDLARIEAGGSKRREGKYLLLRPGAEAFLRELFGELNGSGRLCLSTLVRGADVAAYQIGLLKDGRYTLYNRSYNQEFANISPGMVLEARVVETLAAEGVREYDLSRGKYPAKDRWRPLERRQYDLTIYNRRAGAHLRYLGKRAEVLAKDVARRVLSRETRY